MPKRAEHGFWVRDGLFWDTGCTCNLLQGHTCARRGPSGATLPDCMQRSVQAGWPQASTTPAPLRRAATARMATSPASRLVAATRWPLEAAQASAQPKESKARRPGQHISPGIDHCQSVLLPKKAPTATGPPKTPAPLAKKTAQQKWPPAAPRTRRPILNPSFLIPGPCPRRPLR